jgi:uncharacterized repeat protein (TIGR01451 family)
MKFLKLNKLGKKIAAFVAVAAVASMAIFPTLGMRADSPRFNFLDGDWELISGLNTSNSETVWKDPISASDGETVEGLIYYHNGNLDSVAENTRVKVSLPSSSQNNSVMVTASISADNAQTVTDTVVDGKIVGKSGLTINLDTEAELEYVPGSVKWYPNSQSNPNTSVPLPFGQNGSEIFSANGLNLGNINGCWEYAGFVKFALKVKAPVLIPGIDIQKTVRHASAAGDFSENTVVNITEGAEFKLLVTNNGQTELNNVLVKDVLPIEISSINLNSGKLIKDGVETSLDVQKLVGNGVNIGELGINKSATILFKSYYGEYQTLVDTEKTVTNTAWASSGELSDSDTATVTLLPGNSEFIKHKSAFNKTRNIDATLMPAKAGDEIEYTLSVINIGNRPENYVVEDGIADVLEYAEVISISDGGSVINNAGIGNDATMVRYPSEFIESTNGITRTFTVKVKNPIPNNPQNGFSYDYKMYNKFGDAVTVEIEKPAPPVLKPVLNIEKYVRNVTSNELEYAKANTAYAGDVLEYKIVFKNSGEAPADYFKVWDVLPANVMIDPNAAAVLGMDGTERSIAENMTYGFVVKTLSPGKEGYIRFRVVTSSQIAADEVLKNTAHIEDNGTTISSSAETVIKQKIVQAQATPKLPRTGSAGSIMFSLLASLLLTGSIAFVYERTRR